jgi:uncharacterized membrane protein HdeD (DUF308 family)
MIRLLLLLFGAEVIRRRWRTLLVAGTVWAALGLFIFFDALDDVSLIPVRDFGYLLIVESLFACLAASSRGGARRRVGLVKAGLLLVAGALTIDAPWRSDVALALVIGLMFALDGAMKIVTARVVRFRGWKYTQAAGIFGLLLAIATLEPWPTWYVGTIGCNIGIALALSGFGTIRLARRLRRLPPEAPISMLLSPGVLAPPWLEGEAADRAAQEGELVVRVWTPTGSAGTAARRPLIDRYIAAVDAAGAISTGHAAMELAPDLYISHYPAVEIERSPEDFGRVLRATAENDVPGRFQPSYAEESAGWCEADAHVRFQDFDAARLRAFWAEYRRDTTYNLTNRNCSSVVARALDAALEGRLAHRRPLWSTLLGAILSPELWLASLLRKRAETMAWTPGLVLDYARALSAVLDAPDSPGLARFAVGKGSKRFFFEKKNQKTFTS